jgi:4-hydroxybenzoate polyprenyltransferase
LGEGGIALFNTVHCYAATHSIKLTALTTFISYLTLCALYGFNDYIDRERDAQNPKKHQPFVSLVKKYRQQFITLNLLLCILLLLFTFFCFGKLQSIYLLMLLVINALYSLRIKTIPFADIVIVGVWGAVITLGVPVINYSLALAAGLMTGITHIYQMLSDKEVDKQTHVNTAITSYPNTAFLQVLLLCLCSCIALMALIQTCWIAATAMLPLCFYFLVKKNETAWLFSRIYFGIIWIVLLYNTYGSI